MNRMLYVGLHSGVPTLLPYDAIMKQVMIVKDQIRVYFEMPENSPMDYVVPYHFHVVGTGHPDIDPSWLHVVSVVAEGGYVWHIYLEESK